MSGQKVPSLKRIREEFFRKQIFLFDLDGTLYLGNKVLPGAVDLIARLRDLEKNIFFFTNNSSRSEADYLSKLSRMGFAPRPGEVVMSTHTLIRFLKQKLWNEIYLLGTPEMNLMLDEAHIKHNETAPRAVVVGFDKTLTYKKLLDASRWVSRGLPYVVTHPDLFCPTDEGPEPDCGAFAHVIEDVTKRKPVAVLGKPHRSMIDEVKLRLGSRFKRGDTILIGDRLHTDILMGKSGDIKTLLVLTGETQKRDLAKVKLPQRPNWVLPSVANLLLN